MGCEPLIHLGDLAAVCWAVGAVFAVPAFLFARWRSRPSLPRPPLALVGGSDLALLQARLNSARAEADISTCRALALTEENLKLAAQLAREARRADEALNKLDEVAQRIRHVAPELADELDELNGIGRT